MLIFVSLIFDAAILSSDDYEADAAAAARLADILPTRP